VDAGELPQLRRQAVTPRLALVALLLLAAVPTAGAEGRLRPVTAPEFSAILTAARGKVVVLNLWATWCTPCLKEIPDLIQLEQELGARGVTLIAVGMDDPAELARVDAFRREHFPAFASYLRNEPEMDTLASVFDPAWNELLPTTYLIDRDGKVVRRIQGKRSLADFRAAVGALLD